VFDLEWSSISSVRSDMFRRGNIVDRHFELLGYNLVVSTGIVKQPPPYSDFILSHGYTETLIATGTEITTMMLELNTLNDVATDVVFMAYNGQASDMYVLDYSGIVIKRYVDAINLLTPHKLVSQVDLYAHLFNSTPLAAHWAGNDVESLLRILKEKGITTASVRKYMGLLASVNADLSLRGFPVYNTTICDEHAHVCTMQHT
jgi:hypothetical protein